MKAIVLNTGKSWAPVLLRVLLGIVLWAHGAQKLFGWFGGYGFEGTMRFFTDTVGLPWFMGLMVIVTEFFGALCVIAGFATRIWSFLMVILFIGIVSTSHLQNGFFMNWYGNQKGEGYEYFLLAVAIASSLVITGGGRYAVDRLWMKSTKEHKPVPEPMASGIAASIATE